MVPLTSFAAHARRSRHSRGSFHPLRTLGTRISLAIAVVAAGVSVAVGMMVHNIVARNQLDSARHELDDRLLSTAAEYTLGGTHGGRLDPPDLPGPVADAVREGHRATYLQAPDGDHPVPPTLSGSSAIERSATMLPAASQARVLAHRVPHTQGTDGRGSQRTGATANSRTVGAGMP